MAADDVTRDKRLQAIEREIAQFKKEFTATIDVNTKAIIAQSALLLAAIESLENATDALLAAVKSNELAEVVRHYTFSTTNSELRLIRQHAEILTGEGIEYDEIDEDH
jgi:hypothetical protein